MEQILDLMRGNFLDANPYRTACLSTPRSSAMTTFSRRGLGTAIWIGDSRCDDWIDVEFEVVVDEGPLSAEHRFAALVYACIFFFSRR